MRKYLLTSLVVLSSVCCSYASDINEEMQEQDAFHKRAMNVGLDGNDPTITLQHIEEAEQNRDLQDKAHMLGIQFIPGKTLEEMQEQDAFHKRAMNVGLDGNDPTITLQHIEEAERKNLTNKD